MRLLVVLLSTLVTCAVTLCRQAMTHPNSLLPTWARHPWIAHRGAGKLAPENTLAAFELGAQHGYRMFECDVKLSADGVPFLLHDATLDRTTNGHGPASALTWDELARLDAGSWHSPAFAGTPLLRLDTLARWCLDHHMTLNIELKPSPGDDERTGTVVAEWVQRLWAGHPPPLFTSFNPASLAAAQSAAPDIPRGLLLTEWASDAMLTAKKLLSRSVVGHYSLWNLQTVAEVHAAGMQVMAYTVNEHLEAERLRSLGVRHLITDRVDLFHPTLAE